ncbi:alpha-ketoglutarate permease [Methylobacterium sp. Leaf123]|uniref:MFS family transporter n=1 Tax=Methylobacterium sp. Leaf123 TaxID=1736264 RepID=UPI0006F39A6F|nr:MFS family transporter [Methylobacterium sp. Leaf123]KQQ13234.1 alpha-ketoglutarate permease [Methylobacterium sp. Leaf123]
MNTAVPVAIGEIPVRAEVSDRQKIKAIVAASSGNLVEWYDFYAYAFTSIYFASAFFPSSSPTGQLLATAGIFAVGFFMRPLGGWIFGRIADRRGRKSSMVFSVLLMCAGSLMIGLLPTYESIGVLAPVLLLVARLAQGLSVGGEYGTVATYMSEIAGKGRRGFLSSFQYVTLIGGQLLAVLVVFALQHILTGEEMRAWGWRIPFLIGAAAAIVAMMLRGSLEESVSTETLQREEAGSLRALMQHKRAVLITLAFTMGGSLYFYTMTTYMQKFLVNTVKLDLKSVSTVMTLALVVFMVLQPLFGLLSDRIGRRNNMILFSGLAMVGAVPLLSTLSAVSSPYAAFGLIMVGLIIATFYTSISGVVKAELFPAEVRALGVGLPYAIANAMFGGTAEYVALSFRNYGNDSLFFYYVASMAAVAFAASLWMPDTRKYGYLDGNGQISG